MPSQTLTYNASPTLQKFHKSKAFLRCVLGPIGSGKSVGMCWEVFMLALNQEPGVDGVRKSRCVIIRNTLPELETTTVKTWVDWFPPGDINKGGWGKMTRKPPYTHYLEYYPGDGTKVELEVLFLALDKPEDVKKLLSLEVSYCFINECREIRKEIVDAATGRVGRYPSIKDGGCTRPCIFMDSNLSDDSSWLHKCAEEDGWAVDDKGRPVDPKTIPETERWEFWKQPSGLSDNAENLENLNQPSNYKDLTLAERRKIGRGYYTRMLPGKTKEWINVYVHGEWGSIQQGQAVYGSCFNADIHIADEVIPAIPSGKIYLGIDCSGRHPATVVAQRNSTGQVQIIDELCVLDDEGLSAVAYAQLLKAKISEDYFQHDLYIWGDPAGGFKTQNDERTYFDILRAQGIHVRPSPGLRIPDRVESVMAALQKLDSEGKPYILVSPKCGHLLRGFQGGYRYRKLRVSGNEDRYDDKPEKNRFADVHDALQYMLCGMGEYNNLRGIGRREQETVVINDDWSVW